MCLWLSLTVGSDLGMFKNLKPCPMRLLYNIMVQIFISAGEHDLSDNIVHIVIARLPDAPSG